MGLAGITVVCLRLIIEELQVHLLATRSSGNDSE